MDVLANTDFPDSRTKCAIKSEAGNILHIPREGGYLSSACTSTSARWPDDDDHRVRQTPIEEIIRKANEILHPYSIDVKQVAWHSVYEVGHRLTDQFDDVAVDEVGTRTPRVFIAGRRLPHAQRQGRPGHERLDAGRLQPRLEARARAHGPQPRVPAATYSAERQVIAQNLIDFDREWSSLMARKPEEIAEPVGRSRTSTCDGRVPVGVHDAVRPVDDHRRTADHQSLATGFPIGKRFKSARWSGCATATSCTSATTPRPTGGGASTRSPTAGRRRASALADWADWLGVARVADRAVHAGRRRHRQPCST